VGKEDFEMNNDVMEQAIKTHATRYKVPPELYDKIAHLTAKEQSTVVVLSKKWLPLKWGSAGAALMLAACLAFFMIVSPNDDYLLEQQLLSSHIRSLQEGHLTDVISTDQHTVKPWFNGRLDISPPVVDLRADGFPLIGGRLDYVDHHSVAVIVYKYNAHIINLFVWPSDQPTIDRETSISQQGYHMRPWRNGDLRFWAVSDVNSAKLEEFEHLYRSQTQTLKMK
jgi:anti-sigma factor RsiW